MFNNPFGSFDNTVAEAKEEREQLDRLLTISTPRERLLVAAIAVLLAGLAVWLFAGNVARHLAVDGVLVASGPNLSEGNPLVQALVRIDRGAAPQVKAGMPAAVVLGAADGESGTLHGEIATISALPAPDGLQAFQSAGSASVYRVGITLAENPGAVSLADRECRVVIEIGRQAPAALFRMRPS